MPGLAAYNASIKKSGTSTSFTDEAMTDLGSNIYQITDANKQVFDRVGTFTFYDNGVEIGASGIDSINYLYGKVVFSAPPVGPITVDGDYVPLSEVAGAREFSLNRTCAVLDDTDTSNTGEHTKKYGLQDVSITLSRFDDLSYDFPTLIENRTPLVIEIAPDANKSYRGWFIVPTSGLNLDVNSLLDESISFELDGDDTVGKTFARSDA